MTSKGNFLYEVPDFRGGGERERENAGYQRAGGHLALDGKSGSLTSTFRVHLSELQRGGPGPTAQPALFGEQRHGRSGASLGAEIGDEDLGGSGLLAVQWQRSEYSDSLPPFGQAYEQQARVTRREFGLALWRRMGSLLIRLGGDLGDTRLRADVLDEPVTNLRQAGFWAQGEWVRSVGESGRIRMITGLRADGHDLVDGTRFSPHLSAVHETGRTRIEIAYRNAFSPPGMADLFFQEGVLVRPNPDLRPERVKGEISTTMDVRGYLGRSRIEARLSAYQGDIHDMIFWLPDFQFVWSPDNLDVTRRGFEIGASLEIPLLDRRHSLSGQAAWAHTEYRGEVLHGQVAYRPTFTALAEGEFDLAMGNLTLRANHVGSRRSVPGSDLNSLSPYTILDAGWRSPFRLDRVSGRIELVLTNLLDKRAALLVDYPLPSRGWSVRVHLAPSDRK